MDNDITRMDKRIARGVAVLDERGPADWQNRVDLDLLSMATGYIGESGCGCVLAQVFGSFNAGIRELGLGFPAVDCNDAERHGFDRDYPSQTYAGLDAGWESAITDRRVT